MKEQISITVSRDILAGLDRLDSKQSRSALIEAVLRDYLRQVKRRMQARELQRLNKAAKRLNVEASDVLKYQFRND